MLVLEMLRRLVVAGECVVSELLRQQTRLPLEVQRAQHLVRVRVWVHQLLLLLLLQKHGVLLCLRLRVKRLWWQWHLTGELQAPLLEVSVALIFVAVSCSVEQVSGRSQKINLITHRYITVIFTANFLRKGKAKKNLDYLFGWAFCRSRGSES